MGQKLPPRAGQARRRGLGQCSTPRRAARDGPEGWEKQPGRLGWTGEFRGQPSPAGGRGGERCSQGCVGAARGPAAAQLRGGGASEHGDVRPFSDSPKLAEGGQVGAGGLRAWLWGCVAGGAAVGPDTRTPGGEAGSHSRTLALCTPGTQGAPRRNLAPRTRARPEGGGRPSPRRRGAHPRAATPRPAHAHPPQGPSARSGARGSSQVARGTERKATKQRKQQRESEGGAGAKGPDSPGGGPGRGGTEGAAKAPGVARGLRAQSPHARLPFPPLPGLPAPSQGSSFLHPSGPLRRGAGLSPGD